MFAPSLSRPPYYPSYLPPSADELSSLFQSHSFLPVHGAGAFNEGWKISHGVYLSEGKEREMKGGEVKKVTESMNEMKAMMEKASQQLAAERSSIAQLASFSQLADPHALFYTDPHAYTHYMERQNATMFTLFSFPPDRWAQLKNTPFLRYVYHGMLCADIGRVDVECKHNNKNTNINE